MKLWRKYLQVTAFSALFIAAAGVWLLQPVFASGEQIYVSPASSSVANGSNVTISVRANTGTSSTTAASITLTYDTSKLQYVSLTISGSPIDQAADYADKGNGTISGSAYTLTPASGDILLFSVTFKAKVGSGSASLGFSNSGGSRSALASASDGSDLGAGLTSGAVNFSQPTCASGQTGTWPNCVTPAPAPTPTPTPTTGGTGSTSGGSSSTTTKPKTTTTTPAPSTGTNATPAAPSTTPPPVTDTTPVIASQIVQYTKADITTTSKAPTQVYLAYGITSNSLNLQTTLSDLGVSHKISLDSTQLTPGQTYYYVIVSKDQQGKTTQTAIQSFTTKGITVSVGVFDANHKPLVKKSVILHSTAYKATTDAKGMATFSNVAPGAHELTYVLGKKTYSQNLSIINTIKTAADGTQTATPQNISAVFAFAQKSGSIVYVWVFLLTILLIAGIVVFFLVPNKFRLATAGAPIKSHPFMVGVDTKDVITSFDAAKPAVEAKSEDALNNPLQHVPEPQRPKPGSTIAPRDSSINDTRKTF